MKSILITLLFLTLSILNINAQKYIVYSTNNKVDIVTKKGTRHLKVKDELKPTDVIMIPYNTRLELFDKENKKKFIIKTPGQGSIDNFIKNNNNEMITLSNRLFKFMMTWMTSDVVSRGEGNSDPGTITREEFIDSTVITTRVK